MLNVSDTAANGKAPSGPSIAVSTSATLVDKTRPATKGAAKLARLRTSPKAAFNADCERGLGSAKALEMGGFMQNKG